MLERRYGPPTADLGLKKYHAGTGISVDGLLRSCRKVYDEARELPFELYSFDVNTEYLQDMVSRWLEPWQVRAIRRMHLHSDYEPLGRVSEVLAGDSLAGLRSLEVDVEDTGWDLATWRGERWLREAKVGRVEVVVGFDQVYWRGRAVKRECAEVLEKKMRCGESE